MLSIVSFTNNGKELAHRVKEAVDGSEEVICVNVHNNSCRDKKHVQDIHGFVKKQFDEHTALLFIGATGIAVRLIAPYIKDKLSDIPVVVMDEGGRYVIPILSGHVGGANALAVRLAKLIGAIPVITTATDINSAFAIDSFAVDNKLNIVNRDGIAKVSSKVLDGKTVKVYIHVQGKLGEEILKGISAINAVNIIQQPEDCDVAILDMGDIQWSTECTDNTVIVGGEKLKADLLLTSRRYVVGMGCKEGKSVESLETFLYDVLEELSIGKSEIRAICTIDIKAKEPGLIALAGRLGADFVTYPSEQLADIEGVFNDSDFVKKTVGVGNVCERSISCYMNINGYEESMTVKHKVSRDGMTCAVGRI